MARRVVGACLMAAGWAWNSLGTGHLINYQAGLAAGRAKSQVAFDALMTERVGGLKADAPNPREAYHRYLRRSGIPLRQEPGGGVAIDSDLLCAIIEAKRLPVAVSLAGTAVGLPLSVLGTGMVLAPAALPAAAAAAAAFVLLPAMIESGRYVARLVAPGAAGSRASGPWAWDIVRVPSVPPKSALGPGSSLPSTP